MAVGILIFGLRQTRRRAWPIFQQRCCSSFTIPDKCYIDGKWVLSQTGKVFDVKNPFNEAVIGQVPDCSDVDTELAISAAKKAFQTWKNSSVKQRNTILKKAYGLHKKYSKELSGIMTEEGGKVIAQSIGEIIYGGGYFEWFAEEARRLNGEVLSPPTGDRRAVIFREPAGVAAIITPWNFPNAMLARKVSAVIAAGCTCVIKPAEDTPYSALAIVKILEECGVPPGVVNIVTSSKQNAPVIGKMLSKSPDVRVMSFTGSTAVGKILMEQSASTVKKLGMELGGNAPFIVFESADVEKAVNGAIASKFRHNGQTCVCTNRFLIHESLHDEFVERFLQKMKTSLTVGNPKDQTTTIGPLINKQAVEKVSRHVEDAVNKGGQVVVGGTTNDISPNCFDPTLITGLTPDMLICHQETFGPVAAIMKFKTEDEAIHLANLPKTGLAGYFYSQDHRQIWRVSQKFEVGMLAVNEGIFSSVEIPFGGIKESGLGREGSKYGLDEFTDIRFVCFGDLSS